MEKYNVIIYPAAERDLNDIICYLNTLSPETAVRYYDFLVEKIESLSQMPMRFPTPKNIVLAAKGYRCLIVKNYIVFYVISGTMIQIRRILFNRRNYEDLL